MRKARLSTESTERNSTQKKFAYDTNMPAMLARYAQLLIHYCLELKKDELLYLSTTTLAEPLVREVYREAIRSGAHVLTDLSFREKTRILLSEGSPTQLQRIPACFEYAMKHADAFLNIRAPYNLREEQNVPADKRRMRQEALKPAFQHYFQRTASGAMKRSLCQYPTQANAQEAGMSLEEYERFVFSACRLYDEDPIAAWLELRRRQQYIVDYLNARQTIHYEGPGTDLRFSTRGRTWINSDGRANMPSGEVFTSPVEDSVQGHIHFQYPAIYMGQEVEGVTLWVKDGYIERWEAHRGQEFLDELFTLPGTRRFGEAAIGTNYRIDRFTKNILFDEKIGGTVHMAIGQSYLQAGGQNESSVHWDMIADMRQGGTIRADGELIYENGYFTGPLGGIEL